MDPTEVLHHVNDPLTYAAGEAGEWSLPNEPDGQDGARLPPNLVDYSAGIFVGIPGSEADAVPGTLHPIPIPRRSDVPPSYQTPHEATHRRYEPPFTVAVNQAAAGTTMLVPPKMGLHYIKLLGVFLTLDAAGTIKFVQGSGDGLSVADLSGAMNAGGAAVPPISLPTVEPPNPHLFTSPDQALGITTVTGKAQGWLVVCYSPYEA